MAGPNNKIRSADLDQILKIDGLQGALAVFIRESRKKRDGVESSARKMYQRETDNSRVRDYVLQIHSSMTCCKPDGKDPTDMDRMVQEKVRCSLNWQQQAGEWRKDCLVV